MGAAKVLMTVRGKFLERAPIVSGIELVLFRNDEENFDIFEVKLITPQNRIFVLS